MASKNKTTIGLNLWEGNEYFKREDLVKDNEIIDSNITEIKETLEDKADLVDGKVKAEQLPDMDYASTEHTHTIVDVTGLEEKLDNKADKEHTHNYEPAITNKGSAFNKNFGNTSGTVCRGNDSRLTDSRNAKDVYSWAKASSKPSYNYSEIKNKPSSFTPSSHSHNSTYYTKSEINSKLANIGSVITGFYTGNGTTDGDEQNIYLGRKPKAVFSITKGGHFSSLSVPNSMATYGGIRLTSNGFTGIKDKCVGNDINYTYHYMAIF